MEPRPHVTPAVPPTPTTIRGATLGIALLAGCLLAGCGDLTLTDPVSMDTDETVPSLQFQTQLVTLPDAVDKWGRGMALDEPVAQWKRSWEKSGPEAERIRGELRRAVASLLADPVTAHELESAVSELERTLAGVDHLLGEDFPTHFSPALASARQERDRARTALDAGNIEATLEHLMAGADGLQSVTPGVLAAELITEAEDQLRRIQDDGSYTQETERAQRLLIGARDALERDGGVMALKRAWYAVRLLEQSSSDAL